MRQTGFILGSETEYAHLVTLDPLACNRSWHPDELTLLSLHALMDALTAVCPGAVETQRMGIKTLAEHLRVEEALAGKRECTEQDSAAQQRRGVTGWYLGNGARYYPDLLHPEYSCPETRGPFSAALAQLAGDSIVERCRVVAEERLRKELREPGLSLYVYKNNCNGGHESWGGHENYLLTASRYDEVIPPALRWRQRRVARWTRDTMHRYTPATHALLLFLIVRQVLTGEGKIGSRRRARVMYQLSERAEHFEQIASLDTTFRRGILNTRNIAYTAAETGLRRLHVICGDSNVSQLSMVLKFACTGLVLRMIEDGYLQRAESFVSVPLLEPVCEMHEVSYDITLQHALRFRDGMQRTALSCMEEFLRLAEGYLADIAEPATSEWSRGCALWRQVQTGLSSAHPERTIARSLGWALKRTLLDVLCKQGKLESYNHARAAHAALQYHTTNRAASLYQRLVRAGQAHTLFTEEEVDAWMNVPPADTRAYLRSELIRRYGAEIKLISWHEVHIAGHTIELGDPRKGGREECKRLLDGDPTSRELVRRAASGAYDVAKVTTLYNPTQH